jgi:hypothetical protein
MRRFARWMIAAALFSWLGAAPSWADDSPSPSLEFVRVYAPAERMDDWPLGEQKYVPVDAQEFERLAAIVARGDTGASTESRCRIESLRGVAELLPDRLRGSMTLTVAHEAGAPALLPFATSQLRITAAKWRTPSESPAILGVDPNDRTALLVEQAGDVEIEFTLPGEKLPTGATRYLLEVPKLAAAKWEIIADANNLPSVRGGVVTETHEEPGARRRQSIETLPGETLELAVAATGGPREATAASVQQTTTYVFATNGVEAIVDLQVDGARLPSNELLVALDPELAMVSAFQGATQLEWRSAPQAENTVAIQLPSTENATSATVRVTAWCPLRTGVRWRLPNLRARNVEWRDGQVELLVTAPLGLTQVFAMSGMRQTRVGELAAPKSGESLTFDCHAADASLELRLDRQSPQLRTVSGNVVEIGPRETTSRTVCDLEVTAGESFTLAGEIAPGWLIDDISSVPDDQVREFARDEENNQRMIVHLKQALKPGAPLRLTINARRVNLRNGESAALEMFEPIRWERATSRRRFFSLRSSGDQRWRLVHGEDLPAVRREQLTAAERELLTVTSEETLIRLDHQPSTAELVVEPRPLVFRAEPRIEFHLGPDALAENYAIQCVPEQGAIDTFLVRFSSRRDTPVKWTCEAAIPVAATAERVDSPSHDASTGETWQVRLWPPQTGPFQLRAERRTKIEGRAALGLVEVPGATTKQATARIRAERDVQFQVDASGPQPVVFRDDDASPPLRAEYRYDPVRDAQRAAPAALEVAVKQSAASRASVIVRREVIATRFTSDDEWLTTEHCELETAGAADWSFTLPSGARLLHVKQGDAPADFKQSGDRVTLALAPTLEDLTLEIQYLVAAGEKTSGTSLLPALQLDAPSHPRWWTVQLRRDWELASVSLPWTASETSQSTWQSRLFGAFARSGNESPFVPWKASDLSRWNDSSRGDQRTYEIAGPAQGAPAFALRERSNVSRASLLTALLVGAAVWRLGHWRPVVFAATPLALAAVALLVGESYVTFASAAFLGACAAALAALCTMPREVSTPSFTVPVRSGSTTHTMVVRVARMLVIGGSVFFLAGHAAGNAAPEVIHRVFIPVDDEQLPVGERYFVPQALWDAMRERSETLTGALPEWLVTNAEYVVGSERDPADNVNALTAKYDLRTFGPAAQVELHWGADFFRQVQSIRCNGKPLTLSASDVLRFRLDDAGLHRLEIKLQPQQTESSDRRTSTYIIPPHPRAQLMAWLEPAALAQLELSAPHSLERRAGEGRATASLGSAKSFSFSTARIAPNAMNETPVELEQFIWLRLAPARVTADVRHQIVAAGRPLRELELSIDPRWTLSHAESTSPASSQTVNPLTTGRVRLEWQQPRLVGERFELPLRLNSDAGIGELSFPVVNPTGAVVRRRWCAISLDPALDVASLANAEPAALTASLFAAAWGNVTAAPDRVFLWPPSGATPNLQTTLRLPRKVAEERVTFVARADHLEARLEATVDVFKAPVFVHRITLPPSFDVQDVSVLQEGAQQLARWTRGDGELLAFLRRPAIGRQNVLVTGRFPVSDEAITLPEIGLDADEVRERIVRLDRHADALVDQLSPLPRAIPSTDSAASPSRSLGEWTLPQSQNAIALRVRPNGTPAMAVQLISMHEAAGVWTAHIEAQVDARENAVDVLRFEIPTAWEGPFKVDPPWPNELREVPGATTRLLELRPPTAQQGELRIRVEAPVAVAAGASPAVPDVLLRRVGRLQRLVALPYRSADRRIDWALTNARPARLPGFWQPPDDASTTWKAFEATGAGFSAIGQTESRPAGTPTIRYADYAIRCENDGAYRGRARLSLVPGGLQSLPLRLPAGATILSSHVMGQPVDASESSASGWMLPLLSDQLPQEVEILYAGKFGVGETHDAPTPVAPQVAVASSHWTIAGADALTVQNAGTGASAVALAMERYRAAVDLLEIGLQETGLATAAASSPEALVWFESYLDRLEVARAVAIDSLNASTDRTALRSASVELEKLDQRVAAALGNQAPLTSAWQAVFARTLNVANTENSDSSTPPGKSVRRFRGLSATTPPRIRIEGPSNLAWIGRYALAAMLIAAVWGVCRVAARGDWNRLLRRWSWTLVCLMGLAWWLWLTPSVLGLLIVAFGLLQWFRRNQATALRHAPA